MNLARKERFARFVWRVSLSDWTLAAITLLPIAGIIWSLNT